MRILISLAAVSFLMGVFATCGFSHTPLCSCYDNEDGTIICEGGFSNGSSGAGVKMKVVDKEGNTIKEGRMNEDSEFIFDKPDRPYKVLFDAGPGHVVEVDGKEITE